MGNKSSSFAAGLSFIGTIGEYPDFDAEDDAKKLHKAFHKRIGIKEEVIIEIITTRSNEQRQELANVYKGCFGEAIVDRLDKISRNDLRRTLKALMRTPSEYAARELRKAMRGVGTDEESLIEIICTRGNDELEEVKEVYSDIFDRDLESDIESETRGDFKRLLVAVLQCQREDCDEVDEDAAEADATELYEAGEDRWGTDETAFTLILARRSLLQLRAIIQKYEYVAGGSLESAIESECSRDLRKGYKAIVRLASNPAYYYARNLHKALIGVGTDEESTIRYLVNTSETMLTNVKEEFLESAGKTLDKSIKQNFRGDAKDVLRKIVKGNGYAAEWTPEEEEEEEESEEEEEDEEECCYIMTQCFERINLFRSVHGADSVTLDADLCEKADKWAKELAEKDGLEHSPRDYRENEGENLSGFTGNQPIISSIDRWYAEEKDYDYKTAKFAGNIGHFTQIVWKDSKKFGISWAKSSSGWTYVVARFSPPGNVIITPPGEEECFRKNVQKPDRTLQKTFQTMKITREVHEPKKFEPVTSSHRVAFVKKINEIRKDHKVNPLTEEKDLNKSAQKWADSMAKNDKAENGPGDDMGECLYSYSGPNFQLNSALTAWYGGCEKYNFRKPGWQQGCGNFTQLVWAETTTVGVGAAESKSGKIYVCARFQPPGNMIITPPGEEATFIKNVFSN